MKRAGLLVLLVALIVALGSLLACGGESGPGLPGPLTEIICSDGIDQDSDGLTDCDDPDCAGIAGCPLSSETNCSDGLDDDGDTFIDCADGDCAGDVFCENCNNGVDDADLDANADCGDTDCAAEPRCQPGVEVCDNGLDDGDADVLVDCADSQCVAAPFCLPPVEICNNGLDDDSDGQTDCFDSGCLFSPLCAGVELCCDGIDNDLNGLIDAADPDCPMADGDGDGTTNVCDNCPTDANAGQEDGDDDGRGDACDNCVAGWNPTQVDRDADGAGDACDCLPLDATARPGLVEVCDGVDNDCDGGIDEGCDDDNDNYCDPAIAMPGAPPPTCTAGGGDCNDTVFSTHPNAVEICGNGVDDDCDGLTDAADPDAAGGSPWYRDVDGDGFGGGTPTITCNPAALPGPANWVGIGGDCDDSLVTGPAINPAAVEVCDGVDNDCDMLGPLDLRVDEGCDDDNDNFCDNAMTFVPPGGTTCGLPGDCNDAQQGGAAIFPGQFDPCDGFIDSNCAGDLAIEVDDDGDGFAECQGDCDDMDAARFPGNPEVCDQVDNNCDGVVPVAEIDDDMDGFAECEGDCDDADPARFPGNPEACDGVDNDCDTVVPANEADADMDMQRICAGDCNDGNAAIFFGNPEICDSLDNDCNGPADDGVGPLWYPDGDVDTFGDASAPGAQACAQPMGFVASNTDCNDSNALINPLAAEACDGVDEDCDGAIDDGFAVTPWFADADGDTFGDPAVSVMACAQPMGFVADMTDCDDSLVTGPARFPGNPEICDGLDNDCANGVDDGLVFTTYFPDMDGDMFGTGAGTSLCANPGAGFATAGGDCDDGNAAINPGAAEVCNGVDDDCDAAIDETGAPVDYFTDGDMDGFGTGAAMPLCVNPGAGFSTVAGDCNDGDPAINPGAAEICNDPDNDCDGLTNEGCTLEFSAGSDCRDTVDDDGDGFIDGDDFDCLGQDCQTGPPGGDAWTDCSGTGLPWECEAPPSC